MGGGPHIILALIFYLSPDEDFLIPLKKIVKYSNMRKMPELWKQQSATSTIRIVEPRLLY